MDTQLLRVGVDNSHLNLVIEYGESLGIPHDWYRNVRPYYDWKTTWHDILHELGHLAVYPNNVLEEYQLARIKVKDRGSLVHGLITPDLIHEDQELLAAMEYYPNEYGVRCWCLDVLKVLGLPDPLYEPGYKDYPPGKRPRNAAQWLEPHPYFEGRDQLERWGIDVLKGRPRPTNEPLVVIEGSYCPLDRKAYAEEVHRSTHNGSKV